MGVNIKEKISLLEKIEEEKDLIITYINKLDVDEREKFLDLVKWGVDSKCIAGLEFHEDKLVCIGGTCLTKLGKIVYEGRKDLILK